MADYDASSLPDQTGRTIVITGASSGIGRATAEALARAGAHIVLAVRNTTKGQAVAETLPGSVEVRPLDLADLRSVRAFAARWSGPLDVLVANAGVSARSLTRTADGFELDFGTNHLGHFALTNLLLPHVRDRVVVVASQTERAARLDLDDPNWERRHYRASRAYNDSKLANLLFVAELQRRLEAAHSTVRAVAAHPGLVLTSIYDLPAGARRGLWDRLLPRLGQDAAHGALPTLYAATEDLPGGTFTGPQHLMHMRGGAQVIGQSKRSRDHSLALRLWAMSEQLTKLAASTA